MAIITVPYTDINATMRGIRTQVIDSIDYVKNNLPRYRNPEQMFNNLKQLVVYKNDPPGVELLQSVQTLIENNYWGIPGAGDCDCFSILVLTCCPATAPNALFAPVKNLNVDNPFVADRVIVIR